MPVDWSQEKIEGRHGWRRWILLFERHPRRPQPSLPQEVRYPDRRHPANSGAGTPPDDSGMRKQMGQNL